MRRIISVVLLDGYVEKLLTKLNFSDDFIGGFFFLLLGDCLFGYEVGSPDWG